MDYRGETSQEKTDSFGMPEGFDKQKATSRFSLWKVLLFVVIAIYFVLTAYRVPILITLGEYLIVEHKAKKADAIVCLAGQSQNIERALAVVDAYRQGLAPAIIRALEREPDGFTDLKKTVRDYPTSFDLFVRIVRGFEIPEKAIITSTQRAESTMSEAKIVRDLVLDRGFKSIIVITSRTHSRRAWLTFKKVFKNTNVTIISLPSRYQQFNSKNWWTKRSNTKEFIFEYQKLIYYKIAYLI